MIVSPETAARVGWSARLRLTLCRGTGGLDACWLQPLDNGGIRLSMDIWVCGRREGRATDYPHIPWGPSGIVDILARYLCGRVFEAGAYRPLTADDVVRWMNLPPGTDCPVVY